MKSVLTAAILAAGIAKAGTAQAADDSCEGKKLVFFPGSPHPNLTPACWIAY